MKYSILYLTQQYYAKSMNWFSVYKYELFCKRLMLLVHNILLLGSTSLLLLDTKIQLF